MVRPFTAIDKITKLIEDKQLRIMKKWSDRATSGTSKRHPYLDYLIKKIRSLLVLISGDDVVSMLKGKEYLLLIFKY